MKKVLVASLLILASICFSSNEAKSQIITVRYARWGMWYVKSFWACISQFEIRDKNEIMLKLREDDKLYHEDGTELTWQEYAELGEYTQVRAIGYYPVETPEDLVFYED